MLGNWQSLKYKIYFFVHMCICVYADVHMCGQTHIILCIYACGHERLISHVLLQVLSSFKIFFETTSLTRLEFDKWTRLAGQ